jgi:prophage regulatory protein
MIHHATKGQIMIPFDTLSDETRLRLSQFAHSKTNETPLIPASATTIWRWVKQGSFPKPQKLGARCTAWRLGDLRDWLSKQ